VLVASYLPFSVSIYDQYPSRSVMFSLIFFSLFALGVLLSSATCSPVPREDTLDKRLSSLLKRAPINLNFCSFAGIKCDSDGHVLLTPIAARDLPPQAHYILSRLADGRQRTHAGTSKHTSEQERAVCVWTRFNLLSQDSGGRPCIPIEIRSCQQERADCLWRWT